jgi:hypothetical protein
MELKVVCKYAYSAKRADELSFQKKEILTVLDKRDDKGWWLAENSEKVQGLVPSTYVAVVPAAPEQTKPVEVREAVKEENPAKTEQPAKIEKEEFSSDWERRAVVAEKALSELLGVVARDRAESDVLVVAAQG